MGFAILKTCVLSAFLSALEMAPPEVRAHVGPRAAPRPLNSQGDGTRVSAARRRRSYIIRLEGRAVCFRKTQFSSRHVKPRSAARIRTAEVASRLLSHGCRVSPGVCLLIPIEESSPGRRVRPGNTPCRPALLPLFTFIVCFPRVLPVGYPACMVFVLVCIAPSA